VVGWREGVAQEANVEQTCVVAAACVAKGMETRRERVWKGARVAGERGSLRGTGAGRPWEMGQSLGQ